MELVEKKLWGIPAFATDDTNISLEDMRNNLLSQLQDKYRSEAYFLDDRHNSCGANMSEDSWEYQFKNELQTPHRHVWMYIETDEYPFIAGVRNNPAQPHQGV